VSEPSIRDHIGLEDAYGANHLCGGVIGAAAAWFVAGLLVATLIFIAF
jgi:hypothetical protein